MSCSCLKFVENLSGIYRYMFNASNTSDHRDDMSRGYFKSRD